MKRANAGALIASLIMGILLAMLLMAWVELGALP